MKSEMTSAEYRDRLHVGEDVYTIDQEYWDDPIVMKCTILNIGISKNKGFAALDVNLWRDALKRPDDNDLLRDPGPREVFTHYEVIEALFDLVAHNPLALTESCSIDEMVNNKLMNRSILLNILGDIAVDRICHDGSERNAF